MRWVIGLVGVAVLVGVALKLASKSPESPPKKAPAVKKVDVKPPEPKRPKHHFVPKPSESTPAPAPQPDAFWAKVDDLFLQNEDVSENLLSLTGKFLALSSADAERLGGAVGVLKKIRDAYERERQPILDEAGRALAPYMDWWREHFQDADKTAEGRAFQEICHERDAKLEALERRYEPVRQQAAGEIRAFFASLPASAARDSIEREFDRWVSYIDE